MPSDCSVEAYFEEFDDKLKFQINGTEKKS